jgi:ubiquinone/menaquinone biosynthesis C-methylase UbiE
MKGKKLDRDVETSGILIARSAMFYDLVGVTGVRSRRVLDVLKPGKSDFILDVGCGTGTLACLIAEVAGKKGMVAGIDPSSRMLAIARRKAGARGLKIDFRPAAMEKLPFKDGQFDKVYSTLMIHHLPSRVKKQGFAEVRRVLKRGGQFLVVDFGPPKGFFAKALSWPVYMSERYIFSGKDALLPNINGELPGMLKDAGFKKAEVVKVDLGLIDYILCE